MWTSSSCVEREHEKTRFRKRYHIMEADGEGIDRES